MLIVIQGASFDTQGIDLLTGDPVSRANPHGFSDLVAFGNAKKGKFKGDAVIVAFSDPDKTKSELSFVSRLLGMTGVAPAVSSESSPLVLKLSANSGKAQIRTTFLSDSGEATTGPSDTLTLQRVPEPATLTLFGVGAIGLATLLRRRFRALR